MGRHINHQLYRRARQLYLELRDIPLVMAALKEEGWVVSRSTLFRYKGRSKGEWDKSGKNFDKEHARESARKKAFDIKWAVRLAQLADRWAEKIEKTDKPHSQDFISLTNLIKEIKKLKDQMAKSKIGEIEAVKALYDVLITDPDIGPKIEEKWETLLQEAEKRLGEKHGVRRRTKVS